MTVVGAVEAGPWRAWLWDLSLHAGVVVVAGMRWLCSVGRVEQIAAGEFGRIGAVRATVAEGWGDSADEALYAALCAWIDKGVRGDG